MIASLLTDQTLTLENLPRLADVSQLVRILGNHGVDYSLDGKRLGEEATAGQTAHLRAKTIVDTTAPYELVSRMRASFWVIAPLLARMGEARVSLPGGCAIGTRPVDFLLMALERLGAEISIEAGYVVAKAPGGLIGGEIEFPKATVGGTHTAMMAAATARGSTLVRNAAREPEVKDLADCLNKMGARIQGAGTSTIEISGVARLNGARHRVLPDRIEAGHLCDGGGDDGRGHPARRGRPRSVSGGARRLGASGSERFERQQGRSRHAKRRRHRLGRYFDGAVSWFSDRPASPVHGADDPRGRDFAHYRDHLREPLHACAGARAAGRPHQLDGDTAVVEGVDRLLGAPVMATDLRASVSLVIAALAAEGETTVNRVYHLDRGFERLEHKLAACGADITRISG